ncbi:MAG: 2-isopropylmalate synthase [Desulfobulbaceae bacterium]|nr:2-isopropylmalate synthase [Desulfobulbaceae bacterium]
MDPCKLNKYRPYQQVKLTDRSWPDNVITKSPIWCSVDLRDGNQALMQPMSLEEKIEMFQLLVNIGFKEIEVGFPSASQVEFNFTRELIERDLIPDGVVIQVLTQARDHLIKKTYESLRGAKRAVVHLYNSTSTLQRRVVFKMNQQEITELAVKGARLIREQAALTDTDIRYEYSPESFTGTELDFALDICQAVMEEWGATKEKPVIINLPATVEMATPNIYADQIEWFIKNMKNREGALISLHAHNDRGAAVAATELALMAGADRVEGTLFGNGERTGNVDLLALALNMFSQGIDPELNFPDIDRIVNVYERCTKLPVHPRHPYAGKLVYTAFSGSHQDAINKGMDAYLKSDSGLWEVPYLPIDPEDVGRSYESIIRINSQSGKGGMAYIMDKFFGYKLPKEMHPEFSSAVQQVSEKVGGEVANDTILQIFEDEYLKVSKPYDLKGFDVLKRHIDKKGNSSTAEIEAEIAVNGENRFYRASGNGPLDAFCNGLREGTGTSFVLNSYEEHSLTGGSAAKAICYIGIVNKEGKEFWGAGVDTDIIIASIKAVLSGLNRMTRAAAV